MKFRYIKSLAIVGTALLAAGCNENSWNDTFLDGFTGEPTYDNTVTVSYTLTTTDYETIGKALLSVASTDEETAAARAIQNNHYFDQSSPYPAQVAVPYLLNAEQSNFYIYNPGSVVEVSLLLADVPADIAAISAAKQLTVDEDTSAGAIPGMLASEFPDAQEGDYAIVSIGGEDNSLPSGTWTVAQALSFMGNGYEGPATVEGYVSSINDVSVDYGNATYFIKDSLDDSDAQALEVYRGYYLDNTKFTDPSQLQVGAKVVVTGNLVNYNGTLEFTSGNYITSYVAPATKSRAATLTDNIKNLVSGQTLTATAVVTAQSSRGLILTDNAGSIFYYNNTVDLGTYAIGTVVNVSGTVSEYGTGFQLPNTATLSVAGTETYTYPTPTTYTAEMVEAAIGSSTLTTASYVTIEGSLSISGNYYNINIPGVTSGQGSLYTPTDALKGQLADGNTYKFTGYYTGVTSGKYFYMVLTSVEFVSGDNSGSTGGDNGGNGGGNTGGDNNGGNTGGTAAAGDYAIYIYNGSAWTVAPDAVVMQPEGYESLGLAVNKLTDPAVYLPIYMKNAYPYTTAGTSKYVAYNIATGSCACALMEYDGYNWKYVDNFIQDKVAAFAKNGDSYSFRKFIGEEVFSLYEGDKIALNCSYLVVWGGVCMEPVPTGKTYGYPGEKEITIVDGSITMQNGDNAFSFVTTTEYNGTTYTAPEGYFMILDSNGRYMYLQGTYSSFNVRSNNAYITDNAIEPGYLFTATKNDDGTWSIVNTQGDNVRTLYYSDGNNDFAAYTDEQLQRYNGRLPYLYISESSTPTADDETTE